MLIGFGTSHDAPVGDTMGKFSDGRNRANCVECTTGPVLGDTYRTRMRNKREVWDDEGEMNRGRSVIFPRALSFLPLGSLLGNLGVAMKEAPYAV